MTVDVVTGSAMDGALPTLMGYILSRLQYLMSERETYA